MADYIDECIEKSAHASVVYGSDISKVICVGRTKEIEKYNIFIMASLYLMVYILQGRKYHIGESYINH